MCVDHYLMVSLCYVLLHVCTMVTDSPCSWTYLLDKLILIINCSIQYIALLHTVFYLFALGLTSFTCSCYIYDILALYTRNCFKCIYAFMSVYISTSKCLKIITSTRLQIGNLSEVSRISGTMVNKLDLYSRGLSLNTTLYNNELTHIGWEPKPMVGVGALQCTRKIAEFTLEWASVCIIVPSSKWLITSGCVSLCGQAVTRI